MKQIQNKVKKKNPRRRETPFLKLLCFVLIGVGCYLLFEVGKEVYTTITLKRQLSEAQTRYQQVLDENSYLTDEKDKLQNPDYVQSYARGNYMLTKDGEQIFYLPENDSK